MDAFAPQPVPPSLITPVPPARPPRRPRRPAAAPEPGTEDLELLFSLLCHSLGCMEAAEAAEALIARHGGFAEAVAADPDDLARQPELGEAGAALLKAVHHAALRLDQIRARRRPDLRDLAGLVAYLRATAQPAEGMRALFLDREDRLLADEPLPTSAPGRALRRALSLGAEAVLLLRCQASGDPVAAEADIALARSLEQAALLMEIRLRDFVVVGRGAPASLRERGLLGGASGRA